jgi:hypothetical protein
MTRSQDFDAMSAHYGYAPVCAVLSQRFGATFEFTTTAHHHHHCLVQCKIARDGPRLPPSYVARWDVVVSSGPHDAAPAAVADIRATYWIGMTYS